MSQALVDNGASKSVKDKDGHTPYDVICLESDCYDSLVSELESLLSPSTKNA